MTNGKTRGLGKAYHGTSAANGTRKNKGTKFKDIDKNQNKQQLIMGFISMQTETDQTQELRGEKR